MAISHRRTLEMQLNITESAYLLRSFSTDMLLAGKSPATVRAYEIMIRCAIRFQVSRGLPANPANYSTEHLREWFLVLMQEGKAEKTRATYWAALRSFYKWLVKEGELRPETNPMRNFSRPAVHDKERPIYSPEDVTTITASLEPQKWARRTPRERFMAARDLAIFWTFYAEGFRRAELLSMRLTSNKIDDARAVITRKGGHEQEMRLAPRTVRELMRYLRLREQYGVGKDNPSLWVQWNGKNIHEETLYSNLKRRVLAVGLVWNKRSIHGFRHASAVAHVENGMPSNELREQFGWNSDIMVRHYTRHDAQKRAGEAHRKYSPGR